MKDIKINVSKKSVMGLVEGLTATIAQHNPDVDFQTIWASDSEEPKLDIYYREAINDLENELFKFSSSTTQLFDLQALADDFSMTVRTLAYWPSRLSGLLTNQIQNYLVHAIMAGWLSDFSEIPHADYSTMGVSDLQTIKELLLKRELNFAEAARNTDNTTKEPSSATDTYQRVDDGDEKEVSVAEAGYRNEDQTVKEDASSNTSTRNIDVSEKQDHEISVTNRNGDEESKEVNGNIETSERNNDTACQHFHHEHVDWSGGRPPFILR